jgi:coenzyme F420-0:L-glutamate ligase/coenzyme F420-1:gamma-L-glutamate ligase
LDRDKPFTIFKHLALSRRSLRVYEARPIAETLLRDILGIATWAPSAHNRQPWRFAIVTDAGTQRRLALAMGERLREDLAVDGLSPEAIEQDARRSFARITGAAALVCLCISMGDMDHYPDARRNEAEHLMAVQSAAMAGQNLLLAAHAAGLGACWLCAPLFCPEVVQQALELPADWEPQGLITLGYPAQQRERTRAPLETRLIWR